MRYTANHKSPSSDRAPRISIITPVYNGERFIRECVQSVLEQDCLDVEHIFVDGESEDSTLSVIQELAESYPHIRWVSRKDSGQSEAMNRGIELARGELIGFLNVDDYYEPGVLNRVSQLFKTLPVPSFVVGNCNLWKLDGTLCEINRPSRLAFLDLLIGHKIHPLPANPSAYFYHKALHREVGGYREDNHFSMDLDFILRASRVANMVHVDEIWGNFRMVQGAKTAMEIQAGKGHDRVEELLAAYRQQLGPMGKIRFRAKAGLARLKLRARSYWNDLFKPSNRKLDEKKGETA